MHLSIHNIVLKKDPKNKYVKYNFILLPELRSRKNEKITQS